MNQFKKNKKFIIQDWASNILQYSGKFNFSAYGAYTGSPMLFDDFEEAWGWLYERFPEQEDFSDYSVTQIDGEQ